LKEDAELERLKRQRLEKMQRMITAREQQAQAATNKTDPTSILQKVFVGRAWEVYFAAKRQYPQIAEQILKELARLGQNGKLRGQSTGEQLYSLLREIGLDVRLETKIQVLEHGELKSIADKFRGD